MRLILKPVLVIVALVLMVAVTVVFSEERMEEQDPQQYTANNGRWAHTEKTPEELKGDSSKCMLGGKKYLLSHGGAYEEVEKHWTRCMKAKGYVAIYKRNTGSN